MGPQQSVAERNENYHKNLVISRSCGWEINPIEDVKYVRLEDDLNGHLKLFIIQPMIIQFLDGSHEYIEKFESATELPNKDTYYNVKEFLRFSFPETTFKFNRVIIERKSKTITDWCYEIFDQCWKFCFGSSNE